ncbi:MAG: translation initiation factor IF-3, partial [Deltaproteobacteria bacterium CG07_land_8_20_14_0_80_38_7]
GSGGEQLGVYITREALRLAEEEGLDLVEVSPMGRHPVCKIMDFGKFKYEQSKKRHEAKKKQIVIKTKEIKMRLATDEHDIQTKLKHIKRFLEDGDKVKITLRFRGREMAHRELGQERLIRISKEVVNLGEVEQTPKLEGRMLSMIIVPAKMAKENRAVEESGKNNIDKK